MKPPARLRLCSITSARKKARDIEDGCVYGSMSLLSIEKED